jgi:hypothetical protein
VNGSTNAQLAVLSGQLVLEPMELEVAQELGKLFACAAIGERATQRQQS